MIKRKDGFNGEQALILPNSIVKDLEQDAFASMLHITDIGYYPKAWHHFRERKEPINQYVLIYCVEGAGWYRLGDREFKVSANQYFIIPAGSPHVYAASENDPWTIYWIHFKGNMANEYARYASSPIDIKTDPNARISDRALLFEEIFHTLEMGYSKENLLYACSIFYHFLGLLRYSQQYREVASDSLEKSDLITMSIHFMRENIEKKLSLKEIADYIGYSPSHFSVLFNQRTGFPPLTYFNQLKMQRACQLLDFTDMKINQICYKIGIEDCYYFSRLFHKIMGMSPLSYRKMKKG